MRNGSWRSRSARLSSAAAPSEASFVLFGGRGKREGKILPPHVEVEDAFVVDRHVREWVPVAVSSLQIVEEGRMGVRILARAGTEEQCQLLKPFLGISSGPAELSGHGRGSANECERERANPLSVASSVPHSLRL